MTDEQKAALRDALAPLQRVDWRTVTAEEIEGWLAGGLRILGVATVRPYRPPSEVQIAAIQRNADALSAACDAIVRLVGVPYLGTEKPAE